MPKKRNPESRRRSSKKRVPAARGPSLFRGATVAGIIGGTFAVGLFVGDRSEVASSTNPVTSLLAAADKETSRYDEIRESLRLTFHEELTNAAAISIPSSSKPLADAPLGKSAAQASPKVHATDDVVKDAPSSKKNDIVAAAREPMRDAVVAKSTPSIDAVTGARTRSDDDRVSSSSAATSSDTTSDDDETPETRAQRLKLAFARLDDGGGKRAASSATAPSAKQLTAPVVAKATVAEPAKRGAYILQVASLPTLESAEALRARLSTTGRKVRVVTVDIPGRGTVHRVVVTGFASSDDAEKARVEIKVASGLDGLVRVDT